MMKSKKKKPNGKQYSNKPLMTHINSQNQTPQLKTYTVSIVIKYIQEDTISHDMNQFVNQKKFTNKKSKNSSRQAKKSKNSNSKSKSSNKIQL